MKNKIQPLLIILLLGFYTTSHTQNSLQFADSLQQIIENETAANGFIGLSAAAIFPDGSIWQGAAGEAQIGVAVDTSMHFIIGSITKNYLATLVLRLEEQGYFSIEDPISKFLPTFQYVDENITIQQLLNHTSGLSDLEENPAYDQAIFSDMTYQWTAAELVTNFLEPPLTLPGTTFNYSNSNYILLAALIEVTTGNSVETEMRTTIFESLNLTNSWFGGFETPSTPIAGGWVDFDGDGALDDISVLPFTSYLSSDIGAGNILSKPSDLVQYAQRLYEGNFLQPASLDKMLATTPNSAEPPFISGYGFGTILLDLGGQVFWGHDGLRLHQSLLFYNPQKHFGIAICVNHEAEVFPAFLGMSNYISEQLNLVSTRDGRQVEPVLAVNAYPNPFSSAIQFEIDTPNTDNIQLYIYDQLGRKIKTLIANGTSPLIVWDGNQDNGIAAPGGLYFYQLSHGQAIARGVINKL